MAEAAPFQQIADYVRARRGSEVSLSDVVSLAELTAESFNAFFSSMDSAVYRELREIADYISNMKSEIGALQANDLKAERIPAAGRELDLIVQSTETASNTIMECAETIMAADASDPVAYKALVDDKMIAIFEACSFQDLTGQRVRKVVDTLQQIERRVTRFAGAINAKDAEGYADDAERNRAERQRSLMLNGPQEQAKALAQDNIDVMFGGQKSGPAGQDDIDALFA